MTAQGLRVDVEVRQGNFVVRPRFQVDAGVLVLFGPSGAGKTTTLQAIAGLVAPRKGEIEIGGEIVFRRGRSGPAVDVPTRARRIGYVFQDYALFPHLTALQNVAYPLWRRPGANERALELLDRMGIKHLAHQPPRELSGGQQQRVAIARALALQPRVLLLDEPFSALDQALRRDLRRELRGICRELTMPVVLVTHDIAEVLALGDQAVVLEAGEVVAEGLPQEVLQRPGVEPVSRLIEVENVFEGIVSEVAREEGVLRCNAGGVPLVVAYAPLRPGDAVRIGIRAGDILVAAEQPYGLSAQNSLPGTVRAVEQRGFETQVLVDCGLPFRAEVTPRAVERLGLMPGKPIWLVFKSNSCFLIE